MSYKKSYQSVKNSTCFKWTYGHFGNYYRVVKLYLTGIEIPMQSLKSIRNENN